MAQPVKWFASDMAGAPSCTGQVGSLLAILDACLVNGFNLLTLDSLVIAGNVATGTKAGHGYVLHQIVEIAGATPAGLNAQWRVASVSGNTFTFATTGIADQTATGTISAKTVSAGWLKPYSGTNLGAYKSQHVASSQLCLRLDDTVALYASALGYETMSDINTGTNSFGPHYFKKSSAADATVRKWVLIADARGFYLGVAWSNTTTYDFYHFGDFDTLVAGDAWACRLQGLVASGPTTIGQYATISDALSAAGGYVAGAATPRFYSAIYGPAPLFQASMSGMQCVTTDNSVLNGYQYAPFCMSGVHGYNAVPNYDQYASPAPGDAGYHFFPVFIVESSAGGRFLRGSVRGLLHIFEYNPTFAGNYQFLAGVQNVSGGLVMMIRSAGYTNKPLYPQTTLGFNLGDWG